MKAITIIFNSFNILLSKRLNNCSFVDLMDVAEAIPLLFAVKAEFVARASDHLKKT